MVRSVSLFRSLPGLIALSVWLVSLGAVDGCGGAEFSAATNKDAEAEGQAGAGSGGRGGASGSSGKGGSTTGGTGGTGAGGTSSGGTAGKADGSAGAAGCAQSGCPGGQYCNSDSVQCQPCSDVARFRFGAPEKIDTVIGTPDTSQRFPRVTQNGKEMFFRSGEGAHTLWVTPDFGQPGGQVAFVPLVNVANQSQSAPLEVTWRLPNTSTVNFIFDRTTAGGDSRRQLMGASRISGPNVGMAVVLQIPFNTDPATPSSNYSIAVAENSQRAWWMTNRSGAAVLVTASLAGAPTPAPVDIPLEGGCKRVGADAAPWSPRDGAFLLFAGSEQGPSCTANDSARDLHVMVMGPNGQPALPAALRLSDVNKAAWDDTDPSMSPDLCWLYFASNEGGMDYDIFKAPRR
jgi:hypothetical protein